MGRSYCEHGYPEEEDNLSRPVCPMCRALAEVYGDQREQRRYEIARDVMAAIYGGGQIDSRLPKLICEMSVGAADALLAALEGE